MALSAKTRSLLNKAVASKLAGAEIAVAMDANTTGLAVVRASTLTNTTAIARLRTADDTLRARHMPVVARMTTAAAATTETCRILLNTILTKLKTAGLMSSS